MRSVGEVALCVVAVAVLVGPLHARDQPTVADLEAEIRQSELVIRAKLAGIHWEGFVDVYYAQEVTCQIQRVYKGDFSGSQIRVFLNLPGWLYLEGGARPSVAANPGDELIVPLEELELVVTERGSRTRVGPYYAAPCFYLIRNGEIAGSPYALSDELARHRRLDQFERLIGEIVSRPPWQFGEYVPGRVLFFDDFDDGSFAGWTFLIGARGGEAELENFRGEKWVGPGLRWKNTYPESQRGTRGELAQDPRTGNYEGVKDGAQLQIGVYNGRLRLRSTRLWHHATAVAGDPSWQNYQVECDVYKPIERRLGPPDFPELITEPDYREFGVYGRVQVPNLPETSGEHSAISVEFGPYSNEMLLEPMWSRVPRSLWHRCCQIRAKGPDGEVHRAGAVWGRNTRILDLAACQIPNNERIRLKARFTDNRVEGFIDDVKYLDGYLDPLPEIMRQGRIALWVFTAWAEFDNVRVTELVRVEKPGPESSPPQATEGKEGRSRPRRPPPKPPEPLRTWTDATGKFTVEATFISYANGVVKLKRKDGRVVAIDIEQLSRRDQEYVRDKF